MQITQKPASANSSIQSVQLRSGTKIGILRYKTFLSYIAFYISRLKLISDSSIYTVPPSWASVAGASVAGASVSGASVAGASVVPGNKNGI